MAAPVDEVTHAIQTFNKALDVVLKEPRGPKRWRAANNMWLSLSSKHRQTYHEVVEENRLTREAVDRFGFDKKATSVDKADKTIRESLNIPVGAYMWITKSDPEVFLEEKNSSLFFKTFPEYTTREVF